MLGVPSPLDLPVQLRNAAGGLGHALQLDPLLQRGAVAQLIALPQLVQQGRFLHGVALQLRSMRDSSCVVAITASLHSRLSRFLASRWPSNCSFWADSSESFSRS